MVDGWKDDGRKDDQWMYGQNLVTYKQTDKGMDGRKDACMHRRTDGRILDGWVGRWVDVWVDGWRTSDWWEF